MKMCASVAVALRAPNMPQPSCDASALPREFASKECNRAPRPFVWIKTAEEVLGPLERYCTSVEAG